MQRCKRPRCPYDAVTGEECYFHSKEDLLVTDWCPRCRGYVVANRGRCPNYHCTEHTVTKLKTETRHHVRRSGVLDDEQREIADTLEILGVAPEAIKRAVARKPARTHRHRSARRASR